MTTRSLVSTALILSLLVLFGCGSDPGNQTVTVTGNDNVVVMVNGADFEAQIPEGLRTVEINVRGTLKQCTVSAPKGAPVIRGVIPQGDFRLGVDHSGTTLTMDIKLGKGSQKLDLMVPGTISYRVISGGRTVECSQGGDAFS